MKILLVDDHSILLDGVSTLLTKSAYEVVKKAHNVDEALTYFKETEFDILITDFNIVDDNGLVLIRKLKHIYPNLKIIVLSMQDEAHLIKEILKDGVNGHVLKKENHHNLVTALDLVDKEEVYLSDELTNIIHNALEHTNDNVKLNKKESRVLKLIANNYTKKEIGAEIKASDRSVNTLCKSLFKKTKTTSIVGLLKFAYAHNMV
jgi:two-component system nitrate/nitrite response regulator NarL